jgi:plasmid maintenance system killer protein
MSFATLDIDNRQLSLYRMGDANAKPLMPIRSICHKGLWLLYEEDDARGVPPECADTLRDMLSALATAHCIDELTMMPGWPLDALKGELAGRWTLAAGRGCWLIFRFEDGDAFELDLVDHR